MLCFKSKYNEFFYCVFYNNIAKILLDLKKKNSNERSVFVSFSCDMQTMVKGYILNIHIKKNKMHHPKGIYLHTVVVVSILV